MTTRPIRLLVLASLLVACSRPAEAPHAEEPPQQPTNRIAVPEAVRKNLGIQFVKVERRRVAQTLRFPGAFELLPTGRHEVRTPVQGRATVLVRPLQNVKAGDIVARIESPTWNQMRRELGEIEVQGKVAETRMAAMEPLLAAHRGHETSLRDAVKVLEAREQNVIDTQQSIGGQARELAEARTQLARARADLIEAEEKHAETTATIAELRANLTASRDRLALGIHAASAVLSMPVDALNAVTNGTPAWRTIGTVDLRAAADAIVDDVPIASGAWVEPGALVAHATDPAQIRFRARALQSDLGRLRANLPAAAIPATRTADGGSVPGQLLISAAGDPAQRTIDLFLEPSSLADWARPGVTGFLEVETAGTAAAELAIPRGAALQDGLERVFFRRDPADPDKVIRVEADLGIDDGKWVEVKSGLRDGDEVVLAGAYELMLASSGSAPKGGHFHSDGTFHAGEHK